jgi:succinate dehydrogenase / fumarate reductase cytochrome b subunit
MSTPLPAGRHRPEFRNINVLDLMNYRLPVPGMVSIMHRISGAVLFLALPLLLWLFELSLTSELSYATLRGVASHWAMKLLLLGLAWALLHHLVAGIRYLVLDLHVGLDRSAARQSALAVYWISLPLTALVALKLFGVF